MSRKRKDIVGLLSVTTLGLLSGVHPPGLAADPPAASPLAAQMPGNQTDPRLTTLPRVHDPFLAKDGDTYYVFSTGPGIIIYTSKDRLTWQRQGRVFDRPADWTAAAVPGFTGYYWAPSVSFFGGLWHLYYAVSTFGKNRSAIGLATSPTLDPSRPNFHWRDEGLVLASHHGDDWNAIDPDVVMDAHGRPWLTCGSFWSGIKLLRLQALTGKPLDPAAPLIPIAARPHTPEIEGAVEAPFIMRHAGFYYLFVSFDFCCRGADSTYNIRVGRAAEITGPYLDRDGKPMLDGGGTLLLSGAGRWRGPGHNSVFQEHGADWLVFHAYDAEDRGASKLRIEKLTWDAAGWPTASLGPKD